MDLEKVKRQASQIESLIKEAGVETGYTIKTEQTSPSSVKIVIERGSKKYDSPEIDIKTMMHVWPKLFDKIKGLVDNPETLGAKPALQN